MDYFIGLSIILVIVPLSFSYIKLSQRSPKNALMFAIAMLLSDMIITVGFVLAMILSGALISIPIFVIGVITAIIASMVIKIKYALLTHISGTGL